MAKVMIDSKEYDTDEMTEEAVLHLKSLQYVQNKLLELNMRVAAFQTARNAYGMELRKALNIDSNADRPIEAQMPDNITFDE